MYTLDSKTDIFFTDKSLLPVWEKVQNLQDLTLEDGIKLYNSPDLLSIGKMANWLQSVKNSDSVYFVVNQKIEPTNICVLSCKFCDFAVKKHDQSAYEHTIEEILGKLNHELAEVHITGGLHPDWNWDYYLGLVREIKRNFPSIDVKAFTAVEIDFFSKKFKKPVEEILLELKDAGLRTLPGGGAEVFSERVRRLLFNQKIGEKRWLEIHKTAHKLGLFSNATLLYGHIETFEERINHLIKLRDAQKETSGFFSFIPLAFQPGETGIKKKSHFTSAIDDLKTIAISRLFLNNFPHIKAYWIMLTEQLASIALNFGADDMDGTVGGEKIAHDAGAITPMQLAKNNLIKIINDAGKIPVERDIFYNPIKLHSDKTIGRIAYLNNDPFFQYLERSKYKVFSAIPSTIGKLAEKGTFSAVLLSLKDFLKNKEKYDMIDLGIVAKEKATSVLLKSKLPIEELLGKEIGITEDTSTSVMLLDILLRKKFNLDYKTHITSLNNYSNLVNLFDAFLVIGDKALIYKKNHTPDFPFTYDLAQLWREWTGLPFVFAVWAINKELSETERTELKKKIVSSYSKAKSNLNSVAIKSGAQIGLTPSDLSEYFTHITFELGEKEKEAINLFSKMIEIN